MRVADAGDTAFLEGETASVTPPRPFLKRAACMGRSAGVTLAGFGLLFCLWAAASALAGPELPEPVGTLKVLWGLVRHPFHDGGPNDVGIGLQLLSSLGRVFAGFALGAAVAIPAGVLMGASPLCRRLLHPPVQIFRPVSPLAWFPLGLAMFKSASSATLFIIAITSLWPTLFNTALGVALVSEDHKKVGRAFGFSHGRYLRTILIPSVLPHTVAGFRLSLGIAWVVVVAGETLTGRIGIGFFVWESWNVLKLERVMAAILLIGGIGLLLDKAFTLVEKRLSYDPYADTVRGQGG